MRLVFMASPDFAAPVLNGFLERGHEIAALYTMPRAKKGRGKKSRPSPMEKRGREAGIPVRAPLSLKDASETRILEKIKPDAALVFAYGRMIPPEMLAIPPLGFVNLHLSLLPRWRGAAPVARALWAGDKETGVSVMRMDAGLDTGPLLAQRRIPIGFGEDCGALLAKLIAIGGEIFAETVEELARGKARAAPQAQQGATYAEKIRKEECRIDWNKPADLIMRQLMALSPKPGAWCLIPSEKGGAPTRLRILRAQKEEGEGRGGGGAGGEILEAGESLKIACGRDALRIERAQKEGRNAMPIGDFLRGARLKAGCRLL